MHFIQHAHIPRNHIPTAIELSNPITELPLVPRVPLTAAGVHLHQRYRIDPGIADLLASLAGLGAEAVRR